MTDALKKEKPIGEVTHWYDKIGVAVVKLAGALKIGDKIKIKRGDAVFDDSVASLQFDHQPIEAGKKGQEVAVKLSQPAKEGSEIFKSE